MFRQLLALRVEGPPRSFVSRLLQICMYGAPPPISYFVLMLWTIGFKARPSCVTGFASRSTNATRAVALPG